MIARNKTRIAAGTLAIAMMAVAGAGYKTLSNRSKAQDALSAAQGPRAAIVSGLYGLGNGLDGQGGKSAVEIIVPDTKSGVHRFVGVIGSRDEADFKSQDGSGEVMRVTSLDDQLGTLIALRVRRDADQAGGQIGQVYSFRRQDGAGISDPKSERFRLKWSQERMDSNLAIDVDSYLELHGGSVAQAMTELSRRRSRVASLDN